MPFQVGQRVGDYEVVQLLGAGGMGHVYRVRNIISNRTEAMKVLLPDLTAEPDLAKRFISEIRTLAGFDHPNIALLHTALQADNQLIMMMEYVEGYTLEQLASQRNMPITEISGYVSQALSALAYAHSHGVVHRDIKPANLMVTSHGVLKLMDFGIAKSTGADNNNQTKPGTTMGSLYYMSPEQVRGSMVDARSDIYSMGIVLYELLAGRRPFEADTTFSILNQQLNVLPQPPIEINPSLPPRLNEVILTALAKDPAQRFQDADSFRAALRPFCTAPSGQEVFAPIPAATAATNTPVPQAQYAAPVAPPAYANVPPPSASFQNVPPAPRGRSHKALWIATGAIAAVLALVAVGFGIPYWMQSHPAASASTDARYRTPDATASTTPQTVAPVNTPITENIQPAYPNNGGAYAPQPYSAPAAQPYNQPRPRNNGLITSVGPLIHPMNGAPGQQTAEPPSGAVRAEEEQAEERFVQMRARAGADRHAVAQIRSQQEAMGLGLRVDVETADSRLESYLGAADNALHHGDPTAAAREMDKADTEIAILDHFLGH